MIYTLTLNPAIDKMLYISTLKKNVTSRIKETKTTIGGKGTHVSINLQLLGQPNGAFGFSHGKAGEEIIEILKNYGVNVLFTHYPQFESRTNYLLIEETGDCTVVAEKGVPLSDKHLNEIIFNMKRIIKRGDFLILSGDVSNSSDPTVYNRIIDELKDKELKIFLDTSGSSLEKCIKDRPYLIKPNLDELSTLCGCALKDDTDIINAIDSLEAYGIENIAVSLGKNGSLVKTPEGIYRAIPPKVNSFNTIGCGDCFLSGLVYGFVNSLNIIDTIQLATAISAATAESSLSVGFDPARANALLKHCQVTKIR